MEQSKNKIIGFFRQHRRMPGYRELMALTGFRSKNAVYKLINKLVAAGVLIKDSGGKISLNRGVDEIKLLGLVEAGFPAAAEEATLDTLNLDDYLIKNKEASYLLRIKGDSMIEAGIQEGDMVVVERTTQAREGQIVIAEVDGEWTIKYLRRKNGQVYLEPANKNYRPIYPAGDLRIAAVVKGVVRKY
jgi:repressor LexA